MLMSIQLPVWFDYDPSYKDIAQTIGDTAVVVFGFNRHTYFKKVVEALAKNPESQSLLFLYFGQEDLKLISQITKP